MSRSAVAAVGSLVVLVGMLAALAVRGRDDSGGRRLVVYVAASCRGPMEAIARDFEADTGRRVELRFGPSEELLTKVAVANPAGSADLFLPADESYIRMAQARGLVGDVVPIAEMRAVVLTARGNPKGVAAWADLHRPGVRVAVPNPGAAVGKLTREHLAATGRWAAIAGRAVDTGTVTEAANAARVGSVDAAIVWDAVAAGCPGHAVFAPPELDGVNARVCVAVLRHSADPIAAAALARYAADPARGRRHFRAAGFRVIE